jgi:penicillin-binding protein 1A
MEDVVDRGTAASVRAVGYREPAAGKTGTTSDAADIWFIGLTPRLIGSIWMGFDRRQTVVARATGGELVAPVWGRVMLRMGEHSDGWAPPPGVEMRMVDANGNVIGENCPVVGATRREYFLQGTAPVETCYPAYDQYTYTDSLGAMSDTMGMSSTQQSDESWWRRMRERVFGKRDTTQVQPMPTQMDTAMRPPANPTPNTNPASQPPPVEKPKPKPVPYDSLVKPKPDSVRPKTDTTTTTTNM